MSERADLAAVAVALALAGRAAGWQVTDVASPGSIRGAGVAIDGGGRILAVRGGDRVVLWAWYDGRWTPDVVDDQSCGHLFPAAAVGSAGEIFVAYYDEDVQALVVARREPAGWALEAVDVDLVDPDLALVVDPLGRPAVAYFRAGWLRVARLEGGAWRNYPVDEAPRLATRAALGLTAGGEPAVAYALAGGEVRFARLAGRDFVSERVAAGPAVGLGLAFDPTGMPAIVYQESPGPAVQLARFDGAAWRIEPVAASGNLPALAFDAAGDPWVSYRNGALEVVHRTPSGWIVEPGRFDAARDGPALAAGPPGEPVAAYVSSFEDLAVARRVAGAWQVERIESTAGPTNQNLALAIDPGGQPAVALGAIWPGRLELVRFDGTRWNTERVGEVIPFEPALAFDRAGRAAISYYDPARAALVLAREDGPGFTTEVIDPAAPDGRFSALGFDRAGRPLVAYCEAGNRDLKVAWWNGASWDLATIDSGGDVGQRTSLAFDLAGEPAIAYLDATNRWLKLARFDGASWRTEIVATEVLTDHQPGLAFDGAGQPAVSYVGWPTAIRLARFDGLAWSARTVLASDAVGHVTRLAFDRAGLAHVAFPRQPVTAPGGNVAMMLAHETGPGFALDTADYYCALAPAQIGLAFDPAGGAVIAFPSECRTSVRVARSPGVATALRGVVASLAPGWQTAALPLTAASDDETPPFPATLATPLVLRDDLPGSAPLRLYRVLAAGGIDAGNGLRAVKTTAGVEIRY